MEGVKSPGIGAPIPAALENAAITAPTAPESIAA